MAARRESSEPPPNQGRASDDPHPLADSYFREGAQRVPATFANRALAGPASPTQSPLPADAMLPLTVDAAGLSRLLGISPRTIRNLNASARLPRPICLGRRRLWSVREIESWLEAGAPGRDRWEALKESG